MGVKILNEDGSLVYEFRDGLGVPLLYRVLSVAKFTGEDQPEIILNPHVAAFHQTLSDAMQPPRVRTDSEAEIDRLALQVRVRIATVFRHAVLSGDLSWLSWGGEEKRAFARDILFAPYAVSERFVGEFVEEEDSYFLRVREALAAQ